MIEKIAHETAEEINNGYTGAHNIDIKTNKLKRNNTGRDGVTIDLDNMSSNQDKVVNDILSKVNLDGVDRSDSLRATKLFNQWVIETKKKIIQRVYILFIYIFNLFTHTKILKMNIAMNIASIYIDSGVR